MGRVLQLASFSLAEVTYTAGDIGYQVQESVRKASYTVQARQENVSGVVLPAFEGVKSKDGSGQALYPPPRPRTRTDDCIGQASMTGTS